MRTRVIAATLSDHIKSSDHIFIMGHTNSDLDAVGAAVGMWAAVTKGLDRRAKHCDRQGPLYGDDAYQRV